MPLPLAPRPESRGLVSFLHAFVWPGSLVFAFAIRSKTPYHQLRVTVMTGRTSGTRSREIVSSHLTLTNERIYSTSVIPVSTCSGPVSADTRSLQNPGSHRDAPRRKFSVGKNVLRGLDASSQSLFLSLYLVHMSLWILPLTRLQERLPSGPLGRKKQRVPAYPSATCDITLPICIPTTRLPRPTSAHPCQPARKLLCVASPSSAALLLWVSRRPSTRGWAESGLRPSPIDEPGSSLIR